jgi:hypothetical protein
VGVVHDTKAAEVAAAAPSEDSDADALVDFLLLHVDAEQVRSSTRLCKPPCHVVATRTSR